MRGFRWGLLPSRHPRLNTQGEVFYNEAVTPDTAARLARLNAEFYEEHGDDFGDSRPRLNPGVKRVIDLVPPGAAVIDAGCGDAKVGRRLPGRRYLGLDASVALLARALELTNAGSTGSAHLIPVEALSQWPDVGPDLALCQLDLLTIAVEQMPARSADWVLALAVLHHIPGHDQRRDLVRRWASWLKPGGRLAISCWQPQRSPRVERLRRPWMEVGLTDDGLETDDWLLGWQRKGRSGHRYVHVLGHHEVDDLLKQSDLRLLERFSDDGHRRDQADYVIAERL